MTLLLLDPTLENEPVPDGAGFPVPMGGPVTWSLPGFGPMARIATTIGQVHAQALRARDTVVAATGQLLDVLSVDRIRLDRDFLDHSPDAQPIRIGAGSLGRDLPLTDVLVSPDQPVGITRDRFVKARDLLGIRGVSRASEEMMVYTTFRCAHPVTVKMEGLWARIGD